MKKAALTCGIPYTRLAHFMRRGCVTYFQFGSRAYFSIPLLIEEVTFLARREHIPFTPLEAQARERSMPGAMRPRKVKSQTASTPVVANFLPIPHIAPPGSLPPITLGEG